MVPKWSPHCVTLCSLFLPLPFSILRIFFTLGLYKPSVPRSTFIFKYHHQYLLSCTLKGPLPQHLTAAVGDQVLVILCNCTHFTTYQARHVLLHAQCQEAPCGRGRLHRRNQQVILHVGPAYQQLTFMIAKKDSGDTERVKDVSNRYAHCLLR